MKYLLIPLLAFCAGFPAGAQSMQMQPLPIVLPKPLFEGTPAPPKVPNLEKLLGKPRPAFLAAAGTTNMALH